MRVETAGGGIFELGTTEAAPTIGIIDYSRRVTDDFGVTTVVERGFARRMSVRLAVPFTSVDTVQRRMADLRGTSALWVADDRFAWLGVQGFYKDFALDVNTAPLSYCTLTVEGLAGTETVADAGGDPAPDGRTSSLQLLQPIAVTGSMLTASNVTEMDYPEWAAGATYVKGARVIKPTTNRIYESVVAGNIGNDPAGVSGKWIEIAVTNRWAMFDEALGSVTSRASLIEVTIAPGTAIDAVALLDVTGSTVRVIGTGYDRMMAPTGAPGSALFLDLPSTAGNLTIRISGPGTVSVGTLLIGRLRGLGITEASPGAGITDYSRKDVDDFGAVTVVKRAWAKRMNVAALIRTDALDIVANRIAAVRARPSLWIGGAGLDSLTVYGFFKDFSIEVGEGVSKLTLSIEGLSSATAVKPLVASVAWPDILDPTGTKPADNADVTGNNTSANSNALGGINAAIVLGNQAAVAQAVQDNADAIAGGLATLQGELADGTALQDTVNTSLQTQVDGATASITSQGLTIAGHTGSLASQDTRITTATTNANSALSQIGTLATVVSDNNSAAGSRIDTVVSSISAGAPNLLANGDFSDGLRYWNRNAEGNVLATYHPDIGYYVETNGDTAVYQDVPVEPGRNYFMSLEGIILSGNPDLAIQFWSAGYASQTGITIVPASGISRTTRKVFNAISPAGTAIARIIIFPRAGGAIQASRIMLQINKATIWNNDRNAGLVTASVTQQSGTLVTLAGKTQAFFQITAQVPGQRTQMTIRADGDGGGGVDIDGDVRIKGNVTILGIIRANAFVTDQGVDLAAVVPGSFNWLTSGGQTLNTSLGAGSTTGANAGSGIVNVGGQKVTVNFAMTSNAGAGAGSTIFRVTLLRSVAGGGWAGVIVLGDINPTNVSSSKSLGPVVFTMGNFGPTQFAIDIQNIGDKGGGVQVVNYNMEGAFFK